jgi:hypothetical protein
MKPKQVSFKVAKDSDIPLNGKQLDLLALIGDAGADGALVYGRGPTETVEALAVRGLVLPRFHVQVVIMGKLEKRTQWILSGTGKAQLGS